MPRRLAFAVVLTFLPSAAAARPLAPPALRTDTVAVPMPDGVTLRTIVVRPDDAARHAAVLVRSPYPPGAHGWLAPHLAPRGYVLVLQAVRGTGGSGGTFVPFVAEGADGLATVEWLARQPWSDGRVGLWGVSYLAYAAYAIAEQGHAAVKAMVVLNGWAELDGFVRPGGALALGLALPWMSTFGGRGRPPASPEDEAFRRLPVGALMPGMDRLMALAARPYAWERLAVPVLHVGGWNDYTLDGTLAAYETLARRGRAAQALVVGPWAHNQLLDVRARTVGLDSIPVAALAGTDSVGAWTAAWFDAHLAGTGRWDRPPVRLWLQGASRWTTPASWPAGDAHVWHLGGGGRLVVEPGRAVQDTFTSNPHDPVPTIAGATPQFFPEWIGPRDRRRVQARGDVLVYTAAPLRAPLVLGGRVAVTVRVRTSAPSFDVAATLSAVMPDGTVRHLTDGYRRVRGAPGEVTATLTPTLVELPAGAALRLELAGSNFPRYDRNPGTGEDALTATRLEPVRYEVLGGRVAIGP